MREHLSDNGKLYVADANRLGLKYFAGCQEEYRGGYFSGLENYDKDPERFTEDDRLALQMVRQLKRRSN